MNQFDQFHSALDLTQVSESVFSFNPDSKYFVGNTPHGGYLMALMHKALVTVLPHSCALNSNIYYLDRTDAAPAELHVEMVRSSRGSSAGQVKLIQGERLTCLFSAICSDFEFMKGHDGLKTPLPDVMNSLDEKKFKVMNYENLKKGYTPSFIQQLDISVYPDHGYVLSYLSDILPPVVQNKYGSLGWVPTLSLTTNIRQLPTTSKLFIDGIAKDINKGYFEQDCNIWDLNANLVSTSRQLAKILKSEEKISSS